MLTGFVRAIFLLGCLSFALFAQVNATWKGGGGNWSTPSNWSWDNSDCNKFAPGVSLQGVGSTCYTANVSIPAGTVNVDMAFTSVVNNFTLGSASLTGNVNPEGTATIASGANVNGGVSAAGTLTNAGTILGHAGGGTIVNIGTIKVTSLLVAFTQGTNSGIIEITGTGSYVDIAGASAVSGPWDNTKGSIQIDSGATLVFDGTITGGKLNANGGVLVGSPLLIAGTVNATSLTIDAPANTSNVTINGTLNVNGMFTLGQTKGVSTLKVNNGGALRVSGGNTTLGAQAGATGQLEISGTSALPTTTGNLIIGAAGVGYVSVANGSALTAGVITIGSQPSANGYLSVAGSANYAALNALRGSASYSSAILVFQGGTLASMPQASPTRDSILARVSVNSASSSWKTQNGVTVQGGGSLAVSFSGAVTVACPSCAGPGNALQVSGNSKVDVNGTGSTLTTPSLGVGAGATLTVENGAAANLALLNVSGTATIQGMGSMMKNSGMTTISGALTIQNQGMFVGGTTQVRGFDENGVYAKLTIQSGGQATIGPSGTGAERELKLDAGTVLIQNDGTLSLVESGGLQIIIGGYVAPATLSVIGGPGQTAGKIVGANQILIQQGGTFSITAGGSVSVAKEVTLWLGEPVPTIDVSSGALAIGQVPSGSTQQGWVTVGPDGELSQGRICPPIVSGQVETCTPNSFINSYGQVLVNGSVSNQGGTIASDPTVLNITQNFQQSSGTLALEIDGTQASQYDQVTARGSIHISGGTVVFGFANGFAPHSGDKFNLLSAPGGISVSGANFTTTGVANGFNYTTGQTSGQFDLTAMNSGTATTSAPPPPPEPSLTSVNAASNAPALAPGSLASAYGKGLATQQAATAPFPWPTTFGGTTVTIIDVTGATTQAPLLYVSPTLVNYQILDTVALGPAIVTVTAGDGTASSGPIDVVPYAPGLFAVNSAGLSASFADCVAADGAQSTILTSQVVNGALVAVPLNLGACQQTILELWTTGLDGPITSGVHATIGGQDATVLYAGPEGVYPGVDQVNVIIPQSLAGAGSVAVVVTAGAVTSNTVNVTIQ